MRATAAFHADLATWLNQEYEADKKKRLGEEGAQPKRIRYKPLKA
jgi:hypothetical protein